MPSFTSRSDQKELLDAEDIPFPDIARNMKELDTINSLLGGHSITNEGLEMIMKNARTEYQFSVLEVGCGGGDNLRAIKNWAKKRGMNFRLAGVDINKECIEFARQQEENDEIEFIHSDYRNLRLDKQPQIIFSSLFCHHFNKEEFIALIKWKEANSSLGFFINDLHRHPLAYYSIKLLTAAFSKSYLVKNDAPLSVLRGFKKEEITDALDKAQVKGAKVYWRWAFRWLIVRIKSKADS